MRRWAAGLLSPPICMSRLTRTCPGDGRLACRRDCRQRRIAGAHHRAPVEIGEYGIEELPHHGAREIAVIFAVTILMSVLASLLPLRRLFRIDPAQVFKA